MHSRARCSDPSLTRIPVPSRSRHIHPLLSRIAHTGLLLTALLLATTAGIANAVDAVDHNTTRSNRQTALADDHNTTRSNRHTAMADDHNTTRSNRHTVLADDHNTTRSNRSTVVGGPEPFALACELHCETGGWRIEVSESLASDNAVLGFQPQDTIYTLGADLYQPGDHYITHATAADGYFVNYPGEAPTAIVGPVYERYGPSPQPSIVYTPPIGDDGLSFCDPDPTTGAAPLTSLLDILEIEGIANTETLPLACEDHTGIEAYAKDPNAGTPGETGGRNEYLVVWSGVKGRELSPQYESLSRVVALSIIDGGNLTQVVTLDLEKFVKAFTSASGGGSGDPTATAIEYGLIAALMSPNGDGTGGGEAAETKRPLGAPGTGGTTRTSDKEKACAEEGGTWVVHNGIGHCFVLLHGDIEKMEPIPGSGGSPGNQNQGSPNSRGQDINIQGPPAGGGESRQKLEEGKKGLNAVNVKVV